MKNPNTYSTCIRKKKEKKKRKNLVKKIPILHVQEKKMKEKLKNLGPYST